MLQAAGPTILCPLAVKIMGSLRHMAMGKPFQSVDMSCHVSRSTIAAFSHTFTAWFIETFSKEFVVGESVVGFDTPAQIASAEAVFRQMGLPGIITSTDGVFCTVCTICFFNSILSRAIFCTL